jgi:hypothetical protein
MATNTGYCIEKTADTRLAVRALGYGSLMRAAMFMAVACATLVLSSQSFAQQNAPQGTREGEFSVFGGYTHALPDYGPFGDNGGTVGADFTRYFHRLFAPSVEARFNFNSGKTINETNSLIGLRLQADMKRFHPYGDVLIGAGHLTFKTPIPPTYVHDTAFAKSYGAGVNFDVSRYFQLKADYQFEQLNFGKSTLVVNNSDFTLTPSYFTAGVVYRLPFRKAYDRNIKP